MLRFVVLTHDHPDWHWDFMLEAEGKLRTWRLDQEPNLPTRIRATPLPAHRILYLEYEGPVSGQRGQVQRWDQGCYELLDSTGDSLSVVLLGTRLRGRATLTTGDNNGGWFQFLPDSR